MRDDGQTAMFGAPVRRLSPRTARMMKVVADSLHVWVRRGEVALTEEQIVERAANIVQGLLGVIDDLSGEEK